MNDITQIKRSHGLGMEDLWRKSQEPTISGYPPASDKLAFAKPRWEEMVASGCIGLPHGPWHVDLESRYRPGLAGKTDRLITPDNPASAAQADAWKAQGLLVTTLGLPLHPLAEVGFTTVFEDGSRLGMFTGPGRHWRYGPGLIGNLGLRRVCRGQPEYLAVAVERSGSVSWSLPGGHAEPGQSAHDAALGEAKEEAGVAPQLVAGLPGHMVQAVPSLFGPNTAVAWLDERYLMLNGAENEALLNFVPAPQDTHEVLMAKWMKVGEMVARANFLGSHLREVQAFEASIGSGG